MSSSSISISKWSLQEETELGYNAYRHIPVLLDTQLQRIINRLSERQAVEILTEKLFRKEEEDESAVFDMMTGHIERDMGEAVFYPPILYRVAENY